MALTSADLARLGPQAQKQVLDKLVGEQKSKKSKYGNRKVIRDGIKFDSEREAARFGELKVLRAMGKIRDLSEDKAPKGPIPTEQRIGERVKAWRQMRGLNQEALAERAGIADSTISCIERGGRYGAVSTYLYIAEALNVPIETLLGGE